MVQLDFTAMSWHLTLTFASSWHSKHQEHAALFPLFLTHDARADIIPHGVKSRLVKAPMAKSVHNLLKVKVFITK